MNEIYLEKLISLIKQGIITISDIKNIDYKIEIENRLSSTIV